MYLFEEALFENERIFKFAGAELDGDNLTLTMLVRSEDFDALLTDELKAKVKKIVRAIVPESFEIDVVFRKTLTEEKYLLSLIHGFFYEKSPILFQKIDDKKISFELKPNVVSVRIGMGSDAYSYAVTNAFDKALADYLDTMIIEEPEIELYRDASSSDVQPVKVRRITRAEGSVRLVDIKVTVPIIGNVVKRPVYIADAIKQAQESATVCGKVVKADIYKTKAGKPFIKFVLDDTTASMECVYFSSYESRIERMQSYFFPGQTVACEGRIEMNERTAKMSMLMKNGVVCNINFDSIDTAVKFKPEPEYYRKVKPESFSDAEQSEMFATDANTPEMLKGIIVVYDLETTGLSPVSDKIIEIGAAKMEDGVVTETFTTFVNPEMHIPESASEVNNIYDADVEHAPKIQDVMPDFYKFTRGAKMVAHNGDDFDVKFLRAAGAQTGYDFNNEMLDSLKIARNKLKKLKSHKLENLCKYYGIVNENAHRATDDAVATAKVFKKLAAEE